MTERVALCPTCGTASALEIDNCPECGEPLSTIGRVMQRHEESARSPRWLRSAREGAGQLQAQALHESDRRMEAFRQMERNRQAELRQNRSIRQAADRRLMLAAAIMLGLLLVGTVLAAALFPR